VTWEEIQDLALDLCEKRCREGQCVVQVHTGKGNELCSSLCLYCEDVLTEAIEELSE